MSITRTQYQDACNASDAIAIAANLIMRAAKQLDRVPSHFLPELEAIDGTEAVSSGLAFALDKLATRIASDADAAVEDDTNARRPDLLTGVAK